MAQFFCADCNWQGPTSACPMCGQITESLDVEEYSGLPRPGHQEFGLATDTGGHSYADDDY